MHHAPFDPGLRCQLMSSCLAEDLVQGKEDMLVQRDSAALDLDQLRATLDACTIQVVSLEQRNELLRSRMTARRQEIEVGLVCWSMLPIGYILSMHQTRTHHKARVPCPCHADLVGHLGPRRFCLCVCCWQQCSSILC